MSRSLRILVFLSLLAALTILIFSPTPALAKYPGGDPNPPCVPACPTCYDPECNPISSYDAYSRVSLTEGDFVETYSVVKVKSAFGATLKFDLTYNTYNADGSRASIDSVMGYGWTHTYNDFLFTERGDMFRMGPDGRITKFGLSTNGTYVTTTGYFETLVNNLDGSFTITTKNQTKYRYQSIPGTAFLVGGPVLRLTSITNRNNQVTTLHYAGGDLASVTDEYGRSLSFTNDNHHVTSITDPLGRKTTFVYNSAGCLLMTITDPLLKVTSFTYNALFQLTSKKDRDGRLFTTQYRNGLPYAELDGAGGRVFALTNTSNWAVDPTLLSATLMRVYVPSTTSMTDGRGNIWKYMYDDNAHPLTVTAPDGTTTTYTYDPATLQIASITDANLHTTSYVYDAEGNVTRRQDANGNVTTYTYEPVFNQETSMTDPQGRITTYTYDGKGNRISETDPLLGTRSWTYDSHGNIVTSTDKDGNATSFAYDSDGNQQQSSDALSEVTHYTYDVVGNRTSMTDANNHQTQYQYDSLYRLTVQTDALNDTKQYSYDGEGNRLTVIDENNHTTSHGYDLRSRMIKTTDALGKSTIYTYDANNNRLSMTDRNVHTTHYAYDVRNRLIKTTDALGHVSSSTYDGVGNRLSSTDANGHTVSFAYDAIDRRVSTKDALNEVTQWGYDLTGLPGHAECTGPTLGSSNASKRTDGNGKVIYYCYDGLDRRIIEIHKQGSTAYTITANDAVTYAAYDPNSNRLSMTEPDGNTTTYSYDALNRQVTMVQVQTGDTTVATYDPVGNVHTTTVPNSNVTTNTYDALNRLVQKTDSQALVQTIAYDPVGNVMSQLDGNSNGPSYTHDADNRVVTVTDALGKPTQYMYDPVGNQLSVTDRNGNTTSYTYDAINRRVTMTDAQPATTHYQYDNVGSLIKLTDANGHATSFTYDAVNRRIAEKYPDLTHNAVTYTYDAVGNRISRADQKGQTTTYTYSDLYFLLKRTYPISPADIFTYDLSGRLLSATRGSWVEMYAYDGANRIVQSVQNGRTISYVYNIPARIRTVTYPGGRSIVEHMDFRSQLSSVNDGGITPISRYTYDAGERELTRTYRNGAVANYSYDANNWVSSLTHAMGATLIVGFNYAFDDEGNKAYEQELHDTSHSEGYSYDSIYRLIDYKVGTLTGSTIAMVITQTAYNLDPLGNWKSKTTDMVTQTRTHSPSNEIASINATTVLSDFNGNTSDDGTDTYLYDEENRLVQVTAKGTHAVLGKYQYDAFGRRVSKIDNFGVQTFFYYDGRRTVEEQSSSGATQATYVFGNYLDEALTMDRVGQTFYYHQNSLWSVYALTNSAGTAVEGYSYDAYGFQTIHLPGPDGMLWTADDVVLPGAKSAYGNPFLFTGQRYDPEGGLYFYRARSYGDMKGRFLQRDPASFSAGMNLYAYVGDRPTFFSDPLGQYTASARGGSRISDQGDGDQTWFAIIFTVDDPCCTSFNVIQSERHIYWYWANWSDWKVDDGTYGRSDKAASPPYYNDVDTINTKKKAASLPVWDRPSTTGIQFEFEDCLICMGGLHKGLVYGCFEWHADSGGYTPDSGGDLQPPSKDWWRSLAGWGDLGLTSKINE